MFTLNALRACGSPLPRQGEGEGEGLSTAKKYGRVENPSPQSSPLVEGVRRESLPRTASALLPICLWIAALLVTGAFAAGAKTLPIYIEDNHAGTFYWLSQNVDLDQSYTLILFDALSDASGIFDSDNIRNALRNVASAQDRQTLLDRWRSKGAVQCFNWIEPLMPAP